MSSATVKDCEVESLASVKSENEKLREQLEKAAAKIKEMERALHQSKKDMIVSLQELAKIEALEIKIEQLFTSLTKRQTDLKEMLINTAHSSDKLMRQV